MTYPRKLPDLPVRPRRYSAESDAEYRGRVYRWRIWLDHDRNRATLGGPMQSWSGENEIRDYQAWRDQAAEAGRGEIPDGGCSGEDRDQVR